MHSLSYIEPVFRPPSEWKSLILQVTNGCSWNRCTFCEMYTEPQKKFRSKKMEELESELKVIAASGYRVRRIFLADGDATVLSTDRLQQILELINRYLPDIQRVSSYCLPSNLNNKSVEDLVKLRKLGLSLFYVGCETGDTELLELVQKGETYETSLEALEKAKAASIKSSVMILNGLGGTQLSRQHALESARLMNAAQPEYLATLVVEFPRGIERFEQGFDGRWEKLSQQGLFREMELLLETLDLNSTIFRSDHASNYLVLKGVLGKDKQRLLAQVRRAIERPEDSNLRQEYQRGF